MNTAAQAILAALVIAVVIHYMQGGEKAARRYLNFVFTGRGAPSAGATKKKTAGAGGANVVPIGSVPAWNPAAPLRA